MTAKRPLSSKDKEVSKVRRRKNPQCLRTKTVVLTGDDRFWIKARIEKLKKSERTAAEERLLRKVS